MQKIHDEQNVKIVNKGNVLVVWPCYCAGGTVVTNQPRVPSLGSPQAPPGDVHRSLAALPFDGVVIFSRRASISFLPLVQNKWVFARWT